MGTAAIITIEGFKRVGLYKHYDGYPEGTLPWLEKFNKDFTEKRGDDPEYKFAQLIRSSVRDADEFGLDPSHHTGWGVITEGIGDPFMRWGEEYRYRLLKDGTVEVRDDRARELNY